MDIIKLDVPLFLRLLELSREEVKKDEDLHDIAQIVTDMSKTRVVTMSDYNEIVEFMKSQGSDELNDIKRLGGIE